MLGENGLLGHPVGMRITERSLPPPISPRSVGIPHLNIIRPSPVSLAVTQEPQITTCYYTTYSTAQSQRPLSRLATILASSSNVGKGPFSGHHVSVITSPHWPPPIDHCLRSQHGWILTPRHKIYNMGDNASSSTVLVIADTFLV